MKLEVKIQALRFCSTVFNCIFLALGVSVAGCAVWILFDRGSFLTVVSSVELKTVGAGLLVIGGVVMVVSVVGCLGAHSENRFLLLMYMGLLIVLVLGQLFITLLLLINRRKIKESLDEAVDQIIVGYGHRDRWDGLMENVQHYGQCCGRTGPEDWLKNSIIKSHNWTDVLPCSCFNSSRPSFNSSWCSEKSTEPLIGRGNGSYDQGCKQKLSDWLQENALTIVGMDVGLVFIQVVQFVLAVYLYRAFGQKAALKRTNLVDHDHAHLDPAHTYHAHLDPAHLDHAPGSDYGTQNFAYTDPDDGYIDPAQPALYHDDPNYGDTAHLSP
ncbi:CD82 antigen [Thunnus maccoyii]|uniref:CD82 antigen n=1 Tax=Thunnus maccoyii TaxID=8240 RepID=UPI001C4C73DE|nr:CD82 antigen [Thunnus maccoyii]